MFDSKRVERLFFMDVYRETSTSGATVLSDLTAMIKAALQSPENFGAVRCCLQRILNAVQPKDAAAAKNFCDLVIGSGFDANAIADDVRNVISTSLRASEELPVRAELIRLLSSTMRAYQPAELDAEKEFRVEFPWEWIDCMVRVDVFRASAEIADVLFLGGVRNIRDNLQMLLWRLPRITNVLNGEVPIWARIWIDSIRDPGCRDQLTGWFTVRNYAIEPSVTSVEGAEQLKQWATTLAWRSRDAKRSPLLARMADISLDLPFGASEFLEDSFVKKLAIGEYDTSKILTHDPFRVVGVRK